MVHLNLFGQIIIDNKVQFVHTDSSKNMIQNLADPMETNSALRAFNAIHDNLIYGTASLSGDTIIISTPLQTDSLVAGTWLKFQAGFTNSAGTYIKLNGFSVKPVLDQNLEPLKHGQIKNNLEMTFIYNGTAFQLIGNYYSDCPLGYISVNDRFCIQTDEQSPGYFWDAVNYCQSSNARLCTFGEWYYACTQAATLGLNNMTTNYEFIDDASDHSTNVTFIGSAGSCTLHNNLSTTTYGTINQRNYRCCYSK